MKIVELPEGVKELFEPFRKVFFDLSCRWAGLKVEPCQIRWIQRHSSSKSERDPVESLLLAP